MGTQPLPQKGNEAPSQFSAHVYCGQTAGWIKLPLDTKVNLGPGDIVLDGAAATPKRGTAPPVFVSCLLWPNGWWTKTPLGTEVDLGRGHIVLDRHPAFLRKGHSSPLLFSANVYCGHGRPSQLLLSSCCTAHGRESLCFTTDRPFVPLKLPLSMRDLNPI